MSLLDKGNTWVTIYPEEAVVDRDGNIRTRASKEGVRKFVWIAPVGQSGTAARRAEQDNEGYESEKVIRMRLQRKDRDFEIGAQSKVDIEGKMFSVFGDPAVYRCSPRTGHLDYTLRRA